jgi:hypothetical protein
MIGSERMRFCGQCNLNVYNLSGMSRSEAEQLIARNEGRLCVRFYRRRDGSIITKDCPVGLRAIRRRLNSVVKAVSSMVLGLFAGIGVHGFLSGIAPFAPERTMGVLVREGPPFQGPPNEVKGEVGKMVFTPDTLKGGRGKGASKR